MAHHRLLGILAHSSRQRRLRRIERPRNTNRRLRQADHHNRGTGRLVHSHVELHRASTCRPVPKPNGQPVSKPHGFADSIPKSERHGDVSISDAYNTKSHSDNAEPNTDDNGTAEPAHRLLQPPRGLRLPHNQHHGRTGRHRPYRYQR